MQKSEDAVINRRHSIAEIINFKGLRKANQEEAKTFRNVQSEMVLSKRELDINEPTVRQYQAIKPLGNVLVGGHLIKANPLYGCLLTISSTNQKYPRIPENLRVHFSTNSFILMMKYLYMPARTAQRSQSGGADRAAVVVQGNPRKIYLDHAPSNVGKRPFQKRLCFFTSLFIYNSSVPKIFQLKIPYL